MSAARELAATIAGKAPLATRAVKAAVDAGEGRSVAETFVVMRGGKTPIFLRVVKTIGDGLLLEFPSVVGAVALRASVIVAPEGGRVPLLAARRMKLKRFAGLPKHLTARGSHAARHRQPWRLRA